MLWNRIRNPFFRLPGSILLFFAAVLLCGVFSYARAEETGREITLKKTIHIGDSKILFRWETEAPEQLQANVFSGEEALMETAVLENGQLSLHLLRPIRKEETVRILIADENGLLTDLSLTAEEAVNIRLASMEDRIPEMAGAWEEVFLSSLREGKFFLPFFWTDLPFVLYPDEAPEIQVVEEETAVYIRLSGLLPDGWRVEVGAGEPVETVPCGYDADAGCWIGSGSFEIIYLVRNGQKDGFEIKIPYSRQNAYFAEYPIIQYVCQTDTETQAFVCHGWGTARNYQGSIYGVVFNDRSYYAEYGLDHHLSCYYDGVTGCAYEVGGRLLEGEEPEGYVNPVVHEIKK